LLCDDALVHDEGRDYRGLDAIRSWKQETHTKYKYVMEPLDASVSGKTVQLRARDGGHSLEARSISITGSRLHTTKSLHEIG